MTNALQIPLFLSSESIISESAQKQILNHPKVSGNAPAKVFAKVFCGKDFVLFCRRNMGKKACQGFGAKTFLF